LSDDKPTHPSALNRKERIRLGLVKSQLLRRERREARLRMRKERNDHEMLLKRARSKSTIEIERELGAARVARLKAATSSFIVKPTIVKLDKSLQSRVRDRGSREDWRKREDSLARKILDKQKRVRHERRDASELSSDVDMSDPNWALEQVYLTRMEAKHARVKKFVDFRLRKKRYFERFMKEISSKRLNKNPTSLRTWLENNRDAIAALIRYLAVEVGIITKRYHPKWIDGLWSPKIVIPKLAALPDVLDSMGNAFSSTAKRSTADGVKMDPSVLAYLYDLVKRDHFEANVMPRDARDLGTILQVKYDDLTDASRSPFSLSLIRCLLLIAGIEPNPGPPKRDPSGKRTSSDQKKTSTYSQRSNRQRKRTAAIAKSAVDGVSEERARADALREKLQALQMEKDDQARESMYLTKMLEEARERGFISNESDGSPDLVFSFLGTYNPNGESLFGEGQGRVIVIVRDDVWITDATSPITKVYMPQCAVSVAHSCPRTTDLTMRCKNVFQALSVNKEMIKECCSSPVPALFTIENSVRAFLLTGLIPAGGKLRFASDAPERLPQTYTVEPPPDADQVLAAAGYEFDANQLPIQARFLKSYRSTYFFVDGLVPQIPDWSDLGTMKAGICKRLEPKLPARTTEMEMRIRQKVNEFIEYATREHLDPPTKDTLLEKALEGRPAGEKEAIRRGYDAFNTDARAAIDKYCRQVYHCFIKLESYAPGSYKPPRFIMSMDPEWRGVQIAAMSRILWKIEHVTRECNVKGRTAEQITERLIQKFSDQSLVAETDFSSFESCITPWMKHTVENAIFLALADDDCERDFIRSALEREEVNVYGPGWHNHHFHHIRMSGDLWTSIGNLLTNFIIIATCTGWSVEHLIAVGIFEGDDGAFPAPEDPAAVMKAADECGVKLTFGIAVWHALSFCGNHFVEVEGQLQRHRDCLKTLANLCTIFHPDWTTKKHDIMLQRSKCISVLCGPWIPGASAFAAVIVRITMGDERFAVNEPYLLRHGLRKEYNNYGYEKCIPKQLTVDEYGNDLDDEAFAKIVAHCDRCAGGQFVDEKWVLDCLRMAKITDTEIAFPAPLDITKSHGNFYFRDGLRYSYQPYVPLGLKVNTWVDNYSLFRPLRNEPSLIREAINHPVGRREYQSRHVTKMVPADDVGPIYKKYLWFFLFYFTVFVWRLISYFVSAYRLEMSVSVRSVFNFILFDLLLGLIWMFVKDRCLTMVRRVLLKLILAVWCAWTDYRLSPFSFQERVLRRIDSLDWSFFGGDPGDDDHHDPHDHHDCRLDEVVIDCGGLNQVVLPVKHDPDDSSDSTLSTSDDEDELDLFRPTHASKKAKVEPPVETSARTSPSCKPLNMHAPECEVRRRIPPPPRPVPWEVPDKSAAPRKSQKVTVDLPSGQVEITMPIQERPKVANKFAALPLDEDGEPEADVPTESGVPSPKFPITETEGWAPEPISTPDSSPESPVSPHDGSGHHPILAEHPELEIPPITKYGPHVDTVRGPQDFLGYAKLMFARKHFRETNGITWGFAREISRVEYDLLSTHEQDVVSLMRHDMKEFLQSSPVNRYWELPAHITPQTPEFELLDVHTRERSESMSAISDQLSRPESDISVPQEQYDEIMRFTA
jgi:hypothetical protein